MNRLFLIIVILGVVSCSNHKVPASKDDSIQNQNLSFNENFSVEDTSLYSPLFIKGLKEVQNSGGFETAKLVGNKIYLRHKFNNGTNWVTSYDTIKIPSFVPDGVEFKYKPEKDSANLDLSIRKKNITTLIYFLKSKNVLTQGEVTLNSSFFFGSELMQDKAGNETGGIDYFSDDQNIRLRISYKGDLIQFNNDTIPLLIKIN